MAWNCPPGYRMVSEDHMVRVRYRGAGHVTRDAVIAPLAYARRMAALAFRAEPCGFFSRSRRHVRIVAGAAPETASTRAAAGALREVFHVAGHFHAGRRGGSYKGSSVGGKFIAGSERGHGFSGAVDADLTG